MVGMSSPSPRALDTQFQQPETNAQSHRPLYPPPETLKTDFVFPQAQPFQNPGTNAQIRPLAHGPTETLNIKIRCLEQAQSF